MKLIAETLSKPFNEISFDEYMACFEEVKNQGDLALIKFDGPRDSNQYTVVISKIKVQNTNIRLDTNDLKLGLHEVLKKYLALG